ncbi:hypothetical protein IGI04_012594 [Brassica rapa subsp. trilocularis]|uniref:Uncharacterized protein n=1 Tax=Brassica rapa subsp. trilocularis TaxID=1813537 RepID=A0ABQ7N6D4_BRACM|nr:hypothetical protein IGI04_012590 [Brassica rapa subsp. trilocularis]KAG5406475.1 hypothetical protein IGI04_012594 [Brassica rapa subsp. trilocularis]
MVYEKWPGHGVDGEKSAVQVYSHVQELVNLLLSIIIGDGEKLKHQHHYKGSRVSRSRSKSSSSLC